MVSWPWNKRLASLAKRHPFHELRNRTRILVVDDDEHAFPIQLLCDEGYNIEHWQDVKSLDRLERGEFDIIVLDIRGIGSRLSAEDEGFGVLQHLKWKNPAQIIVAFSGESFDLAKQDFFRLADDTMPKPVSVLKCKQVLDELIESKMTVAHYWGVVATLMLNADVPEKKIRNLEQRLAKAAKSGKKFDAGQIISQVLGGGELAARIASAVSKLLPLICA